MFCILAQEFPNYSQQETAHLCKLYSIPSLSLLPHSLGSQEKNFGSEDSLESIKSRFTTDSCVTP